MKNTIVIYKSKTGFAKRYAEWIAEELKCDIRENEKLTLEDIRCYDTIICGGGLYASGINGINFIKSNYDMLKTKNLVVFATGATPPYQDDLDQVWTTNFSEEQRNNIKMYYFRGGFDFSKLSAGNKFLMTMMKAKLKSQKNPDSDVKDLLEAYNKPVDFTDRKNIAPLIELVKEL
jgi:menaquinone-dependent protoporphyrinogen IX oxidase